MEMFWTLIIVANAFNLFGFLTKRVEAFVVAIALSVVAMIVLWS